MYFNGAFRDPTREKQEDIQNKKAKSGQFLSPQTKQFIHIPLPQRKIPRKTSRIQSDDCWIEFVLQIPITNFKIYVNSELKKLKGEFMVHKVIKNARAIKFAQMHFLSHFKNFA